MIFGGALIRHKRKGILGAKSMPSASRSHVKQRQKRYVGVGGQTILPSEGN
jgi:hypothetical protein